MAETMSLQGYNNALLPKLSDTVALPDAKLRDRAAAVASLQRIVAAHARLDAVLVGDGWPLFGDGARALAALAV